jgi:hypothetical protein
MRDKKANKSVKSGCAYGPSSSRQGWKMGRIKGQNHCAVPQGTEDINDQSFFYSDSI